MEKSNNQIFINNISQNGRVFNSNVSYKIKNSNARKAVLISKRTQSSGEATAIALKSLADVTFIGMPTKGLATSNQQISMGGNDFLVLTTAYMYDVNSRKYLEGIIPDFRACNYQELESCLNTWLNNN